MSPHSTDAARPGADREPVILLGRRTAFGRVNGTLATLTADRLLAPVLSGLLADAGVAPETVDDVIIGNAVGGGGNVARLALLRAGLPVTVPGLTVDRQCGSGLEAIVLACRLIAAGAGDIYLAGGVESCSTAPLRAHRLTSTPGRPDFFDRVRFSPDEVGDPEMGVAAENVADRFGITRERQDAFALRSHRLAILAGKSGQLAEEIVSLRTDAGLVGADEGPRPRLTADLLSRFRPAFRPGGTVTAGNSCADADGAVAVLVTSRRTADALGLGGGLRFVDSAVTGTNPNLLGIGGGEAARLVLSRQGLEGPDLSRIEFNEAFAAQVLASLDLLGIAEERANRQGGALAVGHPFGASGALLVLGLLRQCRASASPGEVGLTAVSIAGGLGVAALWRWDGRGGAGPGR
ncbi:acetyl-CoA C-acetyltransferase [Cryobacterium sp. MP_M5]|uniref:thiolase family protein n=1 Tax=unclassified Cryobacterium TaxID=2649013 RepID=UPI001A22665B|nr:MULTISPECIES: thiolase family protein [unclassified Cryobacterium]MBG6057579.1 acetyl-CoA C-acetyltransferase [Cryobacterium sp. MP_M3]MEC5175906.1 acetyl-CoA C-acetyltransferase [Cryobacterium sp. MP_M5]